MYIETERLILKPFTEESEDALCAMLRDDVIKKTYMLPDFEDDAQCRKLARRLRDLSLDEKRFVAGIYRDGQLVGFVNDVETTEEFVEMGYVVATACHNQGIATEALTGLIPFLHRQGFREVITGAFEGNDASIRVMQKAGMKLIDRRDDIEYRGKVHQCVYYVAKSLDFC